MHDALFRRRVTLGELLDAPQLGLRLIAGGTQVRDREVRGAHLTEILEPARWLDENWVMITTGLQLHRDAAAQRRLIRELDEQHKAALGYCLGNVTKSVPSALLDEARRRGFPVFTVPLEVPVRLAITHVNRLLLATDDELFDRAVTLNDFLLAGLDTAVRSSLAPEAHLVANLRSLLELRVDYLDSTGRPVEHHSEQHGELRDRLSSVSKQATTKVRISGQDLLTVPCRLGSRLTGWLVVHLPNSMDTGQSVLAAAQATAKLIAVSVVARQHSTDNRETLGEQLMVRLLGHPADLSRPESEDLETLGQTRALPVLHQLGFTANEPIRALVVQNASAPEAVTAIKDVLRSSKLPYLHTVQGDDVFAAVQGDVTQVHSVAAQLRHAVGIGSAVTGIASVHRSVRQARFALAVINHNEFTERTETTSFLDYDELPLAPWMAEHARETAGEERIGHYLTPLLEQPLLLEAVVQFLRHDQDVPAAARSLHLHPNSMRYRLERAEAALGAPLRRPSVLASLYVALTVNELL